VRETKKAGIEVRNPECRCGNALDCFVASLSKKVRKGTPVVFVQGRALLALDSRAAARASVNGEIRHF